MIKEIGLKILLVKMISYSSDKRIKEIFAKIFTFGLVNKYSPNGIGQLLSTSIVSSLEMNEESFLFKYSDEEIIKNVFRLSKLPKLNHNNLIVAEWLSFIYTEIFFQYKKTFEYIFMYFTIEDAISKFDVYHEMDISQTFLYFESLVHRINLLSKILKNKSITTKQLSVLSGININTLNGYSKKDSILFGASHYNIMVISQILDVRPQTFLEHLFISQDAGKDISSTEKDQLIKDTFLYLKTKNILENIDFYNSESPDYEELAELINKLDKKDNVVINSKDFEVVAKTKHKVYLVSNNRIKDLSTSKIKESPEIVREYSLIKSDFRPYGDKYKL